MSSLVRILHLEDDFADAQLLQDTLELEGIACELTRVDTESAFRAALQQGGFELILADYTLPSFDGLSALKVALQQRPDLPFVFVSGTLGEDIAIEALKIGATDYVLKTHLSRLAPAIKRALREADEKSERKRAENKLRTSEAQLARERDRLSLLLEINNHIITKLEVSELFQAVAVSIRKHLSADAAGFWLIDRQSGRLELKHLDFPTGSRGSANTVVKIPTSLESELWRVRKPESYRPQEDESLPSEIREAARAEALLSAVTAPLVGANGPLGLITLSSRKADAFSQADIDLLSQIGTQMSLALDNAMAYESLRASRDALRQSEAYLAEAQRLSHTGSWAFDIASNRYVYISEECYRIFGFDAQADLPDREAVSRRIHAEDWDGVQRSFETTLREKVDTLTEFRISLPDGRAKHLQAIRHPVLNDAGEVVKLVGTVIDMTERKRADEERDRLHQLETDLAHINRVSMMGELTASIAHEVNQPLAGVVSNSGACLRWLAGDSPNLEEAREAARRIIRDGKRAAEVIARIRAMAKRAETAKEKLDLNETIQDVLALIGDQAKSKGVIIRTQSADDLLPVCGDRVQLQQLALNLIMNGIEAMSGVDDRPRGLIIRTQNTAAGEVLVTIEDSGIGLDPSTIQRIFDPFYTTKPGGMGMGLSVCRSILHSHGGRLRATANDGPGATFQFTLPALV